MKTPPGSPGLMSPRAHMSPMSEDAILAIINRHFPNRHPSLILGRGDDCVELAPMPLALSSDLFLEHIHFRRSYFSLRETGYKALAVNLSDLAAAGANPVAFSLCLMLPPAFSTAEANELFSGMAELAENFKLALSGGDLSLSPDKQSLGFSITIWGQPATPQKLPAQIGETQFLRRGQSNAGDYIFLVQPGPGPLALGLARCGLLALEELGLSAKTLYPAACAAHLTPSPLVEQGLALARFKAEKALERMGTASTRLGLMDLSDGLARDLPRLLNGGATERTGPPQAKKLGAKLSIDPACLHPELKAFTIRQTPASTLQENMQQEKDLLAQALTGGEEYCLLGSCAPEDAEALNRLLPALYFIGTVTEEEGIYCNATNIAEFVRNGGFDHFSACSK